MPDWLTEGALSAYFCCAAVGVIFALAFWTTRRAKYLAGVALGLLMALGVFLIDQAVETDREQVERKLKEMVVAAERGDLTRFTEYFATNFSSTRFSNRDTLLAAARKYLTPGESRRIGVWPPDVTFHNNSRLTCICQFTAHGTFGGFEVPPRPPGKLELIYAKGKDGQWRIESFKLLTLQGEPMSVP
jgi:hypothetical protein